MFRHCRFILRQPVINTCTVHLLLFCTMNQQMQTIISQIITPLHVSTLTCHPKTACNQYLYSATFIILYNEPTNAHHYSTNYHTATCFDTVVSSSDSPQSIPCPVTPVHTSQHQHTNCIYGHHTDWLTENCSYVMILASFIVNRTILVF